VTNYLEFVILVHHVSLVLIGGHCIWQIPTQKVMRSKIIETMPFVFEAQSSDQEDVCKGTHEQEVPLIRNCPTKKQWAT
jgi:hypothetical protein